MLLPPPLSKLPPIFNMAMMFMLFATNAQGPIYGSGGNGRRAGERLLPGAEETASLSMELTAKALEVR